MRHTALATLLLVGCTTPVPPPREPWEAVASVPPERTICGWEERTDKTAVLEVAPDSEGTVSPAQSVAIIAVHAATPYGRVKAALKPAEHSLVRVKIVVDDRWLLPTTYPQRQRQPKKPPPEHRATRIVGRRKVTRDVRRPAERFAALRVKGDRVTLFIENERQAGDELTLSELKPRLATIEPPAEVFALTATDDTPFSSVAQVIQAAACYDRKPGDEPHEIILD